MPLALFSTDAAVVHEVLASILVVLMSVKPADQEAPVSFREQLHPLHEFAHLRMNS